jgi:hypothetical protein
VNRLILIGNGFDLSHGLMTRYTDFINDFWEQKKLNVISGNGKHDPSYEFIFEDEEILVQTSLLTVDLLRKAQSDDYKNYSWFKKLANIVQPSGYKANVFCKNAFLDTISSKNNLLQWVDIEEEYYQSLFGYIKNISSVQKLNKDFNDIKNALEKYLIRHCNEKLRNIDIKKNIEHYMYTQSSLDDFILKPKSEKLENILFLNFNYTPTLRYYTHDRRDIVVIYIHGELDNQSNPIIFGYGDDIDENYKLLENEKRNEYLENMKVFKYTLNNNYRDMLNFINVDEYEILIMGLSCGTSDRTLLQTIFEHQNCKSIKIFYHRIDNDKNNYFDIVMNISRSFTDKKKMREIIVSFEKSEPLT